MGNNATTPNDYAETCYNEFLSWAPSGTSLRDKNVKDVPESVKLFKKGSNYDLAIFLEDLLVNDEQIKKFDDDDVIKCLGIIIYNHITSLSLIGDNSKSWDRVNLAAYFIQTDPNNLVRELVDGEFVWTGNSFYRWNGSVWSPCDECEVRLTDLDSKINFATDFSLPDSKDEKVQAAVAWIQGRIDALKVAAVNFNNDLSKLIADLKQNPLSLNGSPSIIPCRDFNVNFRSARAKTPSRKHLFSYRLSFNPSKDETELVTKFINSFKCDQKELANTIARWGCAVIPTITFVTGPGGSGKTALSEFTQALYGPFSVSSTIDNVDYDCDLVRTCFIELDGQEVPDEETIRNHPCSHLVIITNKSDIVGDTYAGRRVCRLTFTGPIENSDPTILTRICTRKHLGSALGWVLKNYSPSTFNTGNSGSVSSQLDLLMSLLHERDSSSDPDADTTNPMAQIMGSFLRRMNPGCGNSNCTNCGPNATMEDIQRMVREIDIDDLEDDDADSSSDSNNTTPDSDSDKSDNTTPDLDSTDSDNTTPDPDSTDSDSEKSDMKPSFSDEASSPTEPTKTKIFKIGASGVTEVTDDLDC